MTTPGSSAPLGAEKAELRRRMRQVRAGLAEGALEAAAAAITQRVLALPELAAPATVACYVSVRRELPTEALIAALQAAGHTVAVPRIEGPSVMSMRQHALPLVAGASGIPTSDGPPIATVDVALCPGLAFDPSGGRLGYGGGYYDRWLHGSSTLAVGLALDEALLDSVPVSPHDHLMDVIVTPTRTVRTAPGRSP